jgi:nitrite reductase/ring-hydroxylating ferredoxin subunit
MLPGMFIGTSDHDISFRPHKIGNKEWLLIGGVHHLAEEGGNANDHYLELERSACKYFDIKGIDYKWAAHDSISLDKVPYIGRMPKTNRIFVSIGYGAWGITTGFVSAKILTDLITGEDNNWKDFYSPKRIKPVVKSLIKKSSEEKGGDSVDLKTDEGKIINQKDEQIAVYKDTTGKVTAVSAVCTHMGCIVGWNGKDKTWDCPCHGSRFDKTGKVITGPAV